MSKKVVTTVERIDPLEYLAEKANTVVKLKKRTEHLIKIIEERYKDDENLSKLVENLLNTISQPRPPSEDRILHTGYEIASYESKLKNYLDTLTKYTMALEELNQNLNDLKDKLQILEEWNRIIKYIDPYFLLEGNRLIKRATKILNELSLEDPVTSSQEIKLLSRNIDKHLRLVRKIFLKRINELLAEVKENDILLTKVSSFAEIEERAKINIIYEKIKNIKQILEKAKDNPTEYQINFEEKKREIEEIKNFIKNFLKSKISTEEEKILSALSRTSQFLTGKKLGYSYIIELISKETSIPISKTQELLYKLDKKKVIKLYLSL